MFVTRIFVNHANVNIYDLEEARFSLQHPNKLREKEIVYRLVYLQIFNVM
jgi:hypothetical protein